MGSGLGGMVFIVAGIALGYWILTGKAQNFLQAINSGQPVNNTNPTPPPSQQTPPLNNPATTPSPTPTPGWGPGVVAFNPNGASNQPYLFP